MSGVVVLCDVHKINGRDRYGTEDQSGNLKKLGRKKPIW